MSGDPISKPVRFDCSGVLAWARRQKCHGCDAPPVGDAHHYPTRGAGGDDFGIIPACRECHGKMQRYEHPYTHSWQHVAALASLLRFVQTANEMEWASFCSSRERWMDARPFAKMPA